MSNIKVAIAGCGNIGKRHVAVADACDGVEVVGLCDIEPGRMQSLATSYGGLPCHTDFAELLATTDAELIHICTPHALHAPMTLAACAAGRHVLVEKPMALSSEDCRRMIAAAQEHGVELFVVKQNRYNAPVRLFEQALRAGWLGQVHMVECNVLWNRYPGYYGELLWRGRRESEGGALFTQASHFVDLLTWWFGDVTDSQAFLARRLHDIEFEDSGQATLRFASGALGTLNWSTTVWRENFEGSITVLAEHGTVKIGGKYLDRLEHWDVGDHAVPKGISFTDQPNVYDRYQGTSSNHDKVLAEIARKLRGEENTVVDGAEAMRSVAAIEHIYEHARWAEGEPVLTSAGNRNAGNQTSQP